MGKQRNIYTHHITVRGRFAQNVSAQTVWMKIKNPDRPYYSSARFIYMYVLGGLVGLAEGAGTYVAYVFAYRII